ncbi:TetR/AcrR family transcriptional regulator [Streptomyces violaceoruber]
MSEQLNADRPKTRRKEPAGRGSASEQKILAAAKELFLADRYDGVNLERIAARAGVSRQTVYNRFGSKETVFREMVRHHWSAFAGRAGTSPSAGPTRAPRRSCEGSPSRSNTSPPRPTRSVSPSSW